MKIQLVLPGLIWPSAGAAGLTDGLNLPALERMLGLARITRGGRSSFDEVVSAAFGVNEQKPIAALRRLGELNAAPIAGGWICADPVHLHFARERMLLSDASGLDIRADEAAALCTALNAFFAADEPALARFEAGAPDRWYLPLDESADADFFPLSDVVGRPVAHFLPEGPGAHRWQRLANEIQVILHNHPVNQARESEGRPTINSVWFWGAGTLPERLRQPAPLVIAGDPTSRGLARAAGIEPQATTAAIEGDAFVVLDALHQPALHLDAHAWQAALCELEAGWFSPLLAMLKSGRLSNLLIRCPGDHTSLTLELGARDLWKFWRRPCTLESLTRTRP